MAQSANPDLVATTVHESNNMLGCALLVLDSAIVRMKQQPSSEHAADVVEDLETARDAVQRVVLLMRRMHDATRPRVTSHRRLDLDHVASLAARLVHSRVAPHAELRMELNASRDVCGDESQLVQVLTNLLLNAAQSLQRSGARGEISLRSWSTDKETFLEVSDTGPGVPAEIADQIFQPLFTTRAAEGGQGLGLALCLELVHLHEGRLMLDRSLAPGARFVVGLPACASDDAPPR